MTDSTSSATDSEPPDVVVQSWPHGPRSVGKARRLLVSSLDVWGLKHLADAAELVVSELVTNSVRYAREPSGRLIATRFERLDGGVRIEVHDANTARPELRQASDDAERGRGLALVDAVTSGRWGVGDRDGVGKMVWAECTGADPDAATVTVG
ncbi:ATP-binding protein [Actinacidiphila yeochonensis]|uniref:ATP-binding protein n=1 Tax=Actinacidiphila yeochonensis TaxID=89050 RepID=UPI001E288ADE|nr:ATP-binding protein [Actinacidiphila yeochonensis]